MRKMTSKRRIYILLGYCIVITLCYSPALYLGWDGYQERIDERLSQEEVIHDPVSHDDKVIKQKVETTFHDYTVVLRNGIVSPNGVIHHANCKCKSK